MGNHVSRVDGVHRFLERRTRRTLFAVSVGAVVIVSAADALTGVELSLSLFYLIPVMLAAWFVGRPAGIFISLLSTIGWFLADIREHPGYAHVGIPYWNALMMLGFFLIVVVTLFSLHESRTRETTLSRRIQEDLLRIQRPYPPGVQIASAWIPSSHVSGDYVDVLPLGVKVAGFCIADAAGQGIPAALLMSNFQATLRATATATVRPEELCARLNAWMLSHLSAAVFVTLFYGVLDVASGQFTYCNAGHCRPVLVRSDGTTTLLEEGGIPLGIDDHWEYRQGATVLHTGDRLLLYTDGVTENMNGRRELFGEERLAELLRRERKKSAASVRDSVLRAVRAYSGGDFEDDITLLYLAVS